MIKVKYVSGLGAAKYIQIGEGLRYLKSIKNGSEFRLFLEKYAIKLMTAKPHTHTSHHIDLIDSFFRKKNAVAWDGLFIDTSWYKHTKFVGCAGARDGESFFFKVFKEDSECIVEAENSNRVESIYGRSFRIPKVLESLNGLLVTEFVPKGTFVGQEPIQSLIVSELHCYYSRNKPLSQPLTDLLSELRRSLEFISSYGESYFGPTQEISNFIHENQRSDAVYPTSMCHGDFTPWNSFTDLRGKKVIVDVERTSERVIYTDFLHFTCQPLMMSRVFLPKNINISEQISEALGIVKIASSSLLVLYLFEEINIDLVEFRMRNRSKILTRAIRRKIALAATLLPFFDIASIPHKERL